jgi:hypothetical protein
MKAQERHFPEALNLQDQRHYFLPLSKGQAVIQYVIPSYHRTPTQHIPCSQS